LKKIAKAKIKVSPEDIFQAGEINKKLGISKQDYYLMLGIYKKQSQQLESNLAQYGFTSYLDSGKLWLGNSVYNFVSEQWAKDNKEALDLTLRGIVLAIEAMAKAEKIQEAIQKATIDKDGKKVLKPIKKLTTKDLMKTQEEILNEFKKDNNKNLLKLILDLIKQGINGESKELQKALIAKKLKEMGAGKGYVTEDRELNAIAEALVKAKSANEILTRYDIKIINKQYSSIDNFVKLMGTIADEMVKTSLPTLTEEEVKDALNRISKGLEKLTQKADAIREEIADDIPPNNGKMNGEWLHKDDRSKYMEIRKLFLKSISR